MTTSSFLIDDTSTLPPYTYHPIDASREIRLLVLHPSPSFHARLEIHLETRSLLQSYGELVTLQDLPVPYEAVSYVWGAPEFSHSLLCEGTILKVTLSVDTMLRYLRKGKDSRRLWVDAVCINQGDVIEKGPQVALMDRIYGRAVEVHAWLGEAHEEDEVPRLFACMVNLVSVENHANKKTEEWENDPFEEEEYPEGETWDRREVARELVLGDVTDENIERGLGTYSEMIVDQIASRPVGLIQLIQPYVTLFDRMLSRPWFRRRWILQEVVLAQNITVRCGSSTLSWFWFEKGLEVYQRIVPDLHSRMQQESLKSLDIVVDVTKTKYSILELLWKCHASACKEPHDRIGALLSMVTNIVPTYGIRPPSGAKILKRGLGLSYSDHWVKSYADLARLYMKQGHILEVVRHLYAFGSLGEENVEWPSWVPRWYTERSIDNQIVGSLPGRSQVYEDIKLDSEAWHRLLWVGPSYRPVVLYKPDATFSTKTTEAPSDTMNQLYSVVSGVQYQSDSPNAAMSRASQLGTMALKLACISEDSIRSCIRDWDLGNPYQDLNILAQDIYNMGFRQEVLSFANDEEPVADSKLKRFQLNKALKHFRLALFTKSEDEKEIMPCLLPAAIRPDDCMFQFLSWGDYFLLLRPVELGQSLRPPLFRFVGICWACSQNEGMANVWKLAATCKPSTTRLRSVFCDCVHVI